MSKGGCFAARNPTPPPHHPESQKCRQRPSLPSPEEVPSGWIYREGPKASTGLGASTKNPQLHKKGHSSRVLERLKAFRCPVFMEVHGVLLVARRFLIHADSMLTFTG